MRLTYLALTLAALSACGQVPGQSDGTGDSGAAHPGVDIRLEPVPEVNISDEFTTDVRVWLSLRHLGGPDAETFEVVSASLAKDLETFAPLELSLAEGQSFAGLVDGDETTLTLVGSIDATGSDWGLCAAGPDEAMDELRVTLDLALRITPGANDEADDFVFESHSVGLNCVFKG